MNGGKRYLNIAGPRRVTGRARDGGDRMHG